MWGWTHSGPGIEGRGLSKVHPGVGSCALTAPPAPEFRGKCRFGGPRNGCHSRRAEGLDADLLVRKSSGRVFTRCPPSSVVERVLGKNEVTGSIPVGALNEGLCQGGF